MEYKEGKSLASNNDQISKDWMLHPAFSTGNGLSSTSPYSFTHDQPSLFPTGAD